MTPETTSALIAAFNNLGSLYWTDADFVLGDVGNVTEDGVNLCLARAVAIGCGDRETQTYSIHFTWAELTCVYKDGTLGERALARWDEAKRHDDEERERHKREQAAEEAAALKRKRAASKATRTKRELATLARLKAKYPDSP